LLTLAQQIEKSLRILALGGGDVLARVYSLQANVSPENRIALFDAALAAGRYPS